MGANIRRTLDGAPTVPFRYWNKGDLATIGRHRAVARIAGRELTGFLAWLTWLFVHILYLVGIRNRVTVLVQCRLQDMASVEALRHEVSAVVHRSAGVECKVVMVPPKSLPFTSSGKLSRAAAKQKFLSGEIAELSLLTLASGSDSLEAAL